MGGSDENSDRYNPLQKLGEGGGGLVWLVEDRLRPGVHLALKELVASSPDRESSFRREFAMLASLRHPNLAEVHELDLSRRTGLPRFTLEYIEGEDMVAAVRREGPVLLLDLAAEALRALGFLHDFGLVHRDLKPGNLLVRSKPRLGCRLVLLDFGLALQSQDGAFEGARTAGTLPYLAPELLRGAPPSRRSDLYSLGAVVFEAVHGQTPFVLEGNDAGRFLASATQGAPQAIPLPGGYPEGLARWLQEMLSPDPSLRPAQASEALARLNAACGTSYPAEVPASRAARLASGRPPGRDLEIEKLWEHLEPSDGPRLVWLCGGAGSGKTRLLRWLASEAVLRGWEVTAPPEGQAPGRNPVATLERLRARASEQPTLVLLDEVDSAGGHVARFLELVAREGKAPPLRVVAAVRPAEVRHALVRRLLADTGVVPTLRRLDLDPHDAGGIRALAERATGSRAVSDARVDWLLEASEGNPYLVEALLVEGVWEKGGRGRVPMQRPESVVGRVELLTQRGRTWLESLAVLGGEVHEAILAGLSELDAVAAREAADEVVAAGLSREREGRLFPDSRATMEQVIERIEPQRRLQLHRRAAALMVETEGGGADPWRLARLWGAAGERERAIECAVRAAQQAQRQRDPAEAAERFAFALRHLDRRDPRRRVLRLRQAEALEEGGLYPAAVRALGAARVLSKDRAARADALGRQALALARAGRFERARATAQEAMKLARGAGLRVEEARAKQAMGAALVRLNREKEAVPLVEEAVAIFHDTGDAISEADALHVLAVSKSYLRLPGAEAEYRTAADLFGSAGQQARRMKSLVGLAGVLMKARRIDEAETVLRDVLGLAAEHGNLLMHQMALSRLAAISIERGRFDEAIVLAREAEDQALHLGDRGETILSRDRQAEALIACGRPAEAAALLRETLAGALDQVEPEFVDYERMLLAHALFETPAPDHESARTLLEKSLEGCRRRRKRRPLLMALLIDMERRARPECLDPFDPVRMEFEAVAQGADLDPEMAVRADIARAAWLLRSGNPEAARIAAASAASLAEPNSLPVHAAVARSLLSEGLEQLDRGEESATALERGQKLLEEAASRIVDPAARRDFLERPVFRLLRRPASASRVPGDRRITALYEMIRVLNSETDPDALLESILDMALREVRAERGMILVRDPREDAFSVRVARNAEKETERDAEAFSRGIVAQAGAGRSVLTLDAGHDERFRDLKSVSLYGIRSLMCVPLRSRTRIIGTVYLDTRREGALFGPDDLRFLEAFADHAALALENAQKRADLERENRRLQVAAEARVQLGNLVGRSPAMQRVFDLIEKVATSDLPVLILGESGTGKELAARAIHQNSPLRRKTFLSENCAAIPETLLESELFGVTRGAFTGAERDRAGLFEQADGGTLFLDEIGDMSPAMQSRLLRVLQEGELRRVGGDRVIKVKVRLLTATHRELHAEVAAERFRQDLLYRLQVLMIQLPPLRERPGDIPLLTTHLLERISRQRGRPAPRLEHEVMELFERYPWPGNVRQLENSLQRLALLAGDGPISRSLVESEPELRRSLLGGAGGAEAVFSLERSERDQIERALEAAAGNRDRAARLLGISRATIYRKIKEYRLS